MTNLEKDQNSRDRIVSEINKNFFVEAGAGSGKTTMLVNRMVAMVEAGIDISKICAITFTKAAAGEFYERFQKLLIERSNPSFTWEDKGVAGQLRAPTDDTRALCAKALQNIDLCFMGTIDSFCSQVLSEHPSEAGIVSDATIMSDKDIQSLYKQIYVDICNGEHGEQLKKLAKIFRSFHWNAEEVFVAVERLLMDNRNVQFNIYDGNTIDIDQNTIDIDQMYRSDKNEIKQAVRYLLEHTELKYDKYKKSLEAWDKLEEIGRKLDGNWNDNFPRVVSGLRALKDIRVKPVAGEQHRILSNCFTPGGTYKSWLEFTPTQENGLLDKLDNLCYEVSMTFLTNCVPVIEKVMREKGAMTFFEYLYDFRNMLRADAAKEGKLISYIYDRHSYYLIDEFQDTNPMQAEIFFYLSAEKPVEQWSRCVPRKGALFIVGDPKQSIYRFRGADISSFQKVKQLFVARGGEILYLFRNFRSTKKVIEYYNQVFENLFCYETEMQVGETEMQVGFATIPVPEKDSEGFKGIYKYTAYPNTSEDHTDETDPLQIRNIIAKLVGQEEFKISVEGCEPRPIKYSDILVITPSKEHIDDIITALDETGIPMRVEGKVPFERNEALKQIYMLYNAVADTRDQNALFHALKSNLIGTCEEEMVKLCRHGGKISLSFEKELDDEACPTAKKVVAHLEKLKALANRAERLSPAALFSEIMDSYEVYRFVPAENIEVLYYTLELLRNAEKAGLVVSLKDGAKYIERLLSGSSDEERCLTLTDSMDCVHIANLHKVKGLEAPIVILAEKVIPKKPKNPQLRIIHGDNGSEGYIFSKSCKQDDGNWVVSITTSEFNNQREAEKRALEAERKRLVYVGATRARNALIICNSYNSNNNSNSESYWKPLLDKCDTDIFDVLPEVDIHSVQQCEEVEVDSLYQRAKEECIFNSRKAEEHTYSIEKPSETRLFSKLSDEDSDTGTIRVENKVTSNKTTLRDSDVHIDARLLGKMTHKLMEIIVSARNIYDTNQAIDEIIKEYLTPINQPLEGELSKALKDIVKVLQGGGYAQNNGAPQDILNVLLGAEQVYCEVPFCYKDEEDEKVTIWNGVMDVIYCEHGKWHIIDYKTNCDGEGLDEKYKAQLEAYKKAFLSITGNHADAYTYHISI